MTAAARYEEEDAESVEVEQLHAYLGLSPEERYAIVSKHFPEWLKQEPIAFPADHQTYGWACRVPGCESAVTDKSNLSLCSSHRKEFSEAQPVTLDNFARDAKPGGAPHYGWALTRRVGCVICGENREAQQHGYCAAHANSLRLASARGVSTKVWLKKQRPHPPYEPCDVTLCVHDGTIPVHVKHLHSRLCTSHVVNWKTFSRRSKTIAAVKRWELWFSQSENDCAVQHFSQRGIVSLNSLPEKLQCEVRYAIHHHSQDPRRTTWHPAIFRKMIAELTDAGIQTLEDPVMAELAAKFKRGSVERRILLDLPIAVRTLLASEESSKQAGWLDPVIVGAKPFVASQNASTGRQPWDLTQVSQRWLRDLLWDYLRDEALMPDGKRCTRKTLSLRTQSAVFLSYSLRQIREDRGDDVAQISGEDAKKLKTLWDLWYREKIPLLFGRTDSNDPKPLTELNRYLHTVNIRNLLQHSKDKHRTPHSLELLAFNLPWYNPPKKAPLPRPLSSSVYEQLVNPTNIAVLEAADRDDVGWADIWLTHAFQGGRIGETLKLRLGCIGLVGHAQPYIWRDISKANLVDYGMPCYLPIYERLLIRQEKTRIRLRQRYAAEWSALDEAGRQALQSRWDSEMPLFPTVQRNVDLTFEVSQCRFRDVWVEWFEGLGLKGITTHQTRATLATSLLNNGAPPELVRQLLGHISPEALAHYARYGNESMNRHLQQVWAAGPGMDNPGKILLRPTELISDDSSAAAARIDLTVVPVEHGLCRYGPVVGGSRCPFNKNCSAGPQGPCEHFVLTGADLSYWERKRDAAYHFAEGAPTTEARDYIVSQWDPWEPVLTGLREALDELGLLQAAEQLDLRNPLHDYFDPIFSAAWPVTELQAPEPTETETETDEPELTA